MTPFAAIDFETAGYDAANARAPGNVSVGADDKACAFIVRKALGRSGTDDAESMMKAQKQRLHVFGVARSHQDCGLCGEILP